MTGSGDKVRTFIAILIPDEARRALAECIRQLSGMTLQGSDGSILKASI